MLEIDGSQKSGSGTILRLSIALAGILEEPLHIFNIRHRRSKPGLRPQHLESVNTVAKLCNAETEGAVLGSRELWFKPNGIVNGEVNAEIGTAGSIPMLLLTVLPICAYAKGDVRVHVVNGGTDVRHAPTINYLNYVLLPMLERMGLKSSLTIKKFGYYPKGMGEVILNVSNSSKLKSLRLENFGKIEEVGGISVCTFLEKQKVSARQAETAKNILKNIGYNPDIQVVNDKSNPHQKGSSLVLWVKTNTSLLKPSQSKVAIILNAKDGFKPALAEYQKIPQAKNQVEQEEMEAIENALKRTRGIQIKAAEMLGISLRQLRYRIRKFHITVRKINLTE